MNRKSCITFCATAFFVAATAGAVFAGEWKIQENPILSPWAEKVDPNNCHPEYPRPQMERTAWKSLNGLWEYTIQPKDAAAPAKYDGEILVPFPIESALSGVKKMVQPDERLFYQRTFEVPAEWKGQRILLNFEAVDWECTVKVNGKEVGGHRGGYVPFSLDITDALKDGGEQLLQVSVYDATDGKGSFQPRGKQVLKPGGIMYTAVTGIWDSVWIEPVAKEAAVMDVWAAAGGKFDGKFIPSLDGKVYVEGTVCGGAGAMVKVTATDADGKNVGGFSTVFSGKASDEVPTNTFSGEIVLDKPELWTPDTPYLYNLKVEIVAGDKVIDTVTSYFGVRTTTIGKTEDGHMRLLLNGQFTFQIGPLDQGWWPDGLYTAPTDEALKFDIEATKEMGFNMLRKHVKVEPRRFYAWCDKLGILVWQDMVSGDFPISEEGKANYYHEWGEIIRTLRNSPSIIVWVVFNEGWGQFDTPEAVAWTQNLDPTRLADCASGWTDVPGCGAMKDIHPYPGPQMPEYQDDRAMVMGEFGGLGLPVPGHLWQKDKNWGYVNFEGAEALTSRYTDLLRRTARMIPLGLSAAVYTQTTDVEIEVNGLLTYDRLVNKMGAENVKKANNLLFLPQKNFKDFLEASDNDAAKTWRYTFEKPADNWSAKDFDDSAWKEGEAGFGTERTPNTTVRTKWDTDNIWLRKTFTFSGDKPKSLALRMYHDEDVQVFLNGKLVLETAGYTTAYEIFELSEEAAGLLVDGENVIAVSVKQTYGGQYIDLGIQFEE